MSIRTFFLFCFILFSGIFTGYSQNLESISYSLSNLPSLDNYNTFIDNTENVWIYSEGGVVKYSFDSPKLFTVKNGLKTNDIWGMRQDKQGRIWLSYFGKGVRYIKNDSVYSVKEFESDNEMYLVAEHGDTVFFESKDVFSNKYHQQFYMLKNGKVKPVTTASKLDRIVASYPSKGIYLRCNERVTRAYFPNGKSKELPFNIVNDTPYNFFYQADQQVLFNLDGTLDSVLFLVNDDFKLVKTKDYFGAVPKKIQLISNEYSALVEFDGELRYYSDLRTKKRDYQIEKVIESIYKTHGLHFSLKIAKTGDLWITFERGKVLFIPNAYRALQQVVFKSPNRSLNANYTHFVKVENVFVAVTRRYEVCLVNDNLKNIELLYKTEPIRMIKVFGNKVGILHYSRLIVYDLKTKTLSRFKIGLNKYSFDWLNEDEVVFSNGVAFNVITKKWLPKVFSINAKVKRLKVTKDFFFLTGIECIRIVDRKTKKIVFFKEHSYTKRILNIGKYTYLLLEKGGALVFDEKAKLLGKLLPNINVDDIVKYKDRLILFTKYDAYVYSNDCPLVKPSKYSKMNLFLNYQGLQIQRASVLDKYVVLATNNGLLTFDMDQTFFNNDQIVNLSIAGLWQQNKFHKLNHTSELSVELSDFSVLVDCPSYSTFGKVEYFYRLKGYEFGFKKSSQNTFSLTNLPPGEYIFQVFAKNDLSLSPTVELKILVLPKFYQTWWFIVLLFVVIVSIFWYLIQTILRYRQRLLVKKNKLVELEFQALKSQLNPHFIFNSLHTLQAILFQKDEEAANNYLVSLSVLMRTVLTNSRTSTISLKKEINFLESFVNIQSVKMDSNIVLNMFVIGIEKPEELFIRNMILQPFVENAIIHGLTNKIGEKRIDITFKREGDFVKVSIKDNGVGRPAADALNKELNKEHQSLGSSILQEKSVLINQIYNENLHFYFEDLVGPAGPKGTIVHVLLKLIKE